LAFGWMVYASALVFSIWGLGDQAREVWKTSKTAAWPKAVGKVIASDAVRGCGKGSSYYPVVRYQYDVGGSVYESRRITYGNVGCGSKSAAEAHAAEYRVGAPVEVHFNPVSPADAVLQTVVYQETWVGIVIMSALLVILLSLGWWFFGRSSSNPTIERDAPQAGRPSL